ncbi:MAG: hypothetical protein AAGA92_05100 [Planctomycetota bacterium]
MASRPQIGRLALEKELLSVSQVFQVLNAQSDMPDEMFGELAIECGMMTEADLKELLDLQSDQTKPMSQVLVDLGYLTPEQAGEEKAEYRKAMENLGIGETTSVL